ncbi:hypothetical protein ACQP2X_21485 [Actinoplanes sp. CA-131856]
MDVIVQRVVTLWSKRSRGFPNAALRNAVPPAFPLPSGRPPLFHDVDVREENCFEPRSEVRPLTPRAFGLHLAGDVLRVRVPDGFGFPQRRHRPSVTLRRGEWVRWRFNNRSSSACGTGDWHYTLTSLSIAFGPIPLDAFLGGAPHRIDELAALR